MCTQASELRPAPIRSDTDCMEHDTCRGAGVTSCGHRHSPTLLPAPGHSRHPANTLSGPEEVKTERNFSVRCRVLFSLDKKAPEFTL